MHTAIEFPHWSQLIRCRGKCAALGMSREIIDHNILRGARRLVFSDYGIEIDVPVGGLMRDYALSAALTVGRSAAAIGYGEV